MSIRTVAVFRPSLVVSPRLSAALVIIAAVAGVFGRIVRQPSVDGEDEEDAAWL